jgi:hypothetical protein
MTPMMDSVPGEPGCHAICAMVFPEPSSFRQSYAEAGVKSISPRLTFRVESSSKPPGKVPVVQLDCGPKSAFAYQYGRSGVGFAITGGFVLNVPA